MAANDLLQGLLEATLATSAAVALVLLLRKPLRSAFGARAAYGVWALIPASLLAVLLPAMQVAPAGDGTVAVPHVLPTLATVATAKALDPHGLLAGCWASGVLVCVLWMVSRQRRFHRSLGRLLPRIDGLREAECDVQGLPATLGFWRPRVVVPPGFDRRYDAAWRELMLAHERAHVRRGDIHANAIAAALRCLYWFNPLMHAAMLAFRHDQELACDATVMAVHPRARRCYGEALLHAQLASQAVPLGCHFGFGHPLRERIAMLKEQLPSTPRRVLGTLLVAILVLGLATAAWAAQPPREKQSSANIDIEAVSLPVPEYPEDALKNKIGGRVVLEVHVAADGNVDKAVVERSEPAGVFDEAAIAAVAKWKFNPAEEDGKRVAGKVRVPITFEMKPEVKDDAIPMKTRPEEPDPAAYDWIKVDLSAPMVASGHCDVVRGHIANDTMWCGNLRK